MRVLTLGRVPSHGLGEGYLQREDGSRLVLTLGYPEGLAIMYARRPLLWLAILFGSGWFGGYLFWLWMGRRR